MKYLQYVRSKGGSSLHLNVYFNIILGIPDDSGIRAQCWKVSTSYSSFVFTMLAEAAQSGEQNIKISTPINQNSFVFNIQMGLFDVTIQGVYTF